MRMSMSYFVKMRDVAYADLAVLNPQFGLVLFEK